MKLRGELVDLEDPDPSFYISKLHFLIWGGYHSSHSREDENQRMNHVLGIRFLAAVYVNGDLP